MIKILGTGINDSYQACVSVYDNCNILVYEGLTYNGCLCVNLNVCMGYIIVIKSCNGVIIQALYVDNCTLVYVFNANQMESEPERKIITFLLTDFNYTNLPIMKGELILWQRQ